MLDGRPLQALAAQPGRERGRELSIEGGGFTGVRTQRYTYLQYTSGANINFSEMYDLEADPFELQNVASNPDYAGVRARLDTRLAGVRGCSGDSCRLTPLVRIKLKVRVGERGCARRPVRARVKNSDTAGIVLAEFFVNGKRVGNDPQAALPAQAALPQAEAQADLEGEGSRQPARWARGDHLQERSRLSLGGCARRPVRHAARRRETTIDRSVCPCR